QLIPDMEGRLIPVFEIMTLNPGIRNMIRENKIHQIEGMLYSSNQENMISMDNSLLDLVSQGRITKAVALDHATNPEMLKKKLG
ncbi:MAG: type IV pili twitching motility protein PilT, partial [Eubacterium sp.]